MFNKSIAIGLSPNTQTDDFFLACKILLQPWAWRKGEVLTKVRRWFGKYLDCDSLYMFDSGRSSLYFILKSFGIKNGDEILIQAFTCVAVPNAIIKSRAKPIYVDIDATGNIDPGLIPEKINRKTKAIIVQHTFGIPADITRIKKIAIKNKLILIEDCAHSLNVVWENKHLGQFGDASFFSFGRDKVISSVFGGLAVINTKKPSVLLNANIMYKNITHPSYAWIIEQLLHPIIITLLKPIYNFKVSKITLLILQKLKVLSKPVSDKELNGETDSRNPKKYPNALAILLFHQLMKLKQFSDKRETLVKRYLNLLQGIPSLQLPVTARSTRLLRFNILHDKAGELIRTAKENGIILGNWYRNVIDPKGVKYHNIYYDPAMCPQAEKYAGKSVNLPTFPALTPKAQIRITDIIRHICK